MYRQARFSRFPRENPFTLHYEIMRGGLISSLRSWLKEERRGGWYRGEEISNFVTEETFSHRSAYEFMNIPPVSRRTLLPPVLPPFLRFKLQMGMVMGEEFKYTRSSALCNFWKRFFEDAIRILFL